ncbi:uncharacterized protein J3R85_009273 [Psidium guajava]|nr:uncharacterized protein J3R85_009273 [Psidium guajava]
MQFDFYLDDITEPKSRIVFTRSCVVICVDVRLGEWIPHQYIAWYVNVDDGLVRPLRWFDGPSGFDDGGSPTGEARYPQLTP